MSHGEYEDAAKGRCRFCGFLSKHGTDTVNFPSPRFYEVEHSERGYGRFTRHVVSQGMVADTEPMCFMGKINLMAILQNEGNAKLLEAITADRKCQAWYPYMPGLSPKEHYEEYQVQRLEDNRRALDIQLAKMNQEILERSASIATESQKTVADLRAIAQANDRFSRRITFWVILLGALQTLGMLMTLPSVNWVRRFWQYLSR